MSPRRRRCRRTCEFDTSFGLLTGFGFAVLYTLVGIPLWVLPNPSGLNAHYQQPALTATQIGGISAAGACWVALQVAARVENATIVFVVCDRGDRYLSTGVFPA